MWLTTFADEHARDLHGLFQKEYGVSKDFSGRGKSELARCSKRDRETFRLVFLRILECFLGGNKVASVSDTAVIAAPVLPASYSFTVNLRLGVYLRYLRLEKREVFERSMSIE